MSPEKQRIAIAEACGIKLIEAADGWWDAESGGRYHSLGITRAKAIDTLPDYLNDLNAMAEAEKVLTDDQLADMAETLGVDADDAPADSWRLLLRATAAQRAEAFLKTIFKWEQSK